MFPGVYRMGGVPRTWRYWDTQSASTSFRFGIEARAPSRVTEMAAAQFAKAIALTILEILSAPDSATASVSVSITAKAPLKVSPAAVVSMARTFGAGTCLLHSSV
jgi:hypothetical protein